MRSIAGRLFERAARRSAALKRGTPRFAPGSSHAVHFKPVAACTATKTRVFAVRGFKRPAFTLSPDSCHGICLRTCRASPGGLRAAPVAPSRHGGMSRRVLAPSFAVANFGGTSRPKTGMPSDIFAFEAGKRWGFKSKVLLFMLDPRRSGRPDVKNPNGYAQNSFCSAL